MPEQSEYAWIRKWVSARVEFVPTQDGGRRSAVLSGYRPLLRFDGSDELFGLVEMHFDDPTSVAPGASGLARVGFGAPEILPRLRADDQFEVLEGNRVVARGLILEADATAPSRA